MTKDTSTTLQGRDAVLHLIRQGLTAWEVAKVRNCSTQWVRTVAKEEGLNIKAARRGPKLDSDKGALHALHQRIGRALFYFRQKRHDISYDEMRNRLEWPRQTLLDAEVGVHDFTLSEIIKIAEVLEVPLNDLITKELFQNVQQP